LPVIGVVIDTPAQAVDGVCSPTGTRIGRCRYDHSAADRERRSERRADYAADTQPFDTDRLPPVDTLVFECG
jgi:hypothetical protein